MNTLERILELAKKNNMSANKLLVECKLPSNAISYWKQGIKKPGIDALIKIADYFNISIDYLVGRESAKQTIQNTNINNRSDDLKQFIQLWEQMDEFQKASVMGYAQGLINKDLTIQKQNKLF